MLTSVLFFRISIGVSGGAGRYFLVGRLWGVVGQSFYTLSIASGLVTYMNIVGFNFTKIQAERKKSAVGQININNNVSIRDLKTTKIGLGSDRVALNVLWGYESKYSPEMAILQLEGEVILLTEPEKAAEMEKEWKENKRLQRETMQRVMNHILDRCSIQALLLAKDLNLPSPVPLPKVNVMGKKPAQEKETKKAPAKKKK